MEWSRLLRASGKSSSQIQRLRRRWIWTMRRTKIARSRTKLCQCKWILPRLCSAAAWHARRLAAKVAVPRLTMHSPNCYRFPCRHIRTLTGANEALFHAVVGGFKDMYFGTSETERSAALHELGTEDCGQDYLKTMMGGAPSTSLAASSSDHTSFGASKLNANTGTPLEQVVRRTAERFSTALAFAEECTSLERSGGSTSTAPLSTAIFHGVRSALETLRGQGRARVAGVLDLAGSRLEALLLIGPPAADSAESARMHCAEAVLAWARCLRVAAIDINVSVSVSVSVSEPHPADTSTGDDAATPSAINNAITNTTSTRRALLQRLTDREASEPSPVVRKVLVQAHRTLLDSAAHNT